ncbi:hypothetical protein A6R68_01176 [Neotoma lepida]|uniref:Uncharacterized protein n=1 Tax=Neotoma lepida TaxID=56216 RepID=A0A1A6GXF0_NEOLE|nr:hypothetical protein A6R68_01176 [Neotoma lepida]
MVSGWLLLPNSNFGLSVRLRSPVLGELSRNSNFHLSVLLRSSVLAVLGGLCGISTLPDDSWMAPGLQMTGAPNQDSQIAPGWQTTAHHHRTPEYLRTPLLPRPRVNTHKIYHNFNFERDKPELLTNIGRNKLRNPAWASEAQSPVTSAAEQGPSPKKVKLLPTRRSPRLHKAGEDDVMSQQGVPINQTPADNLSTVPSSALEKSQHPCKAPDNCPPQEISGPCGEGMSDKDTVSPLATVKMDGAGHMPSSSSGYLAYGYMMSMYNTCRSILKAALSAVSLSVSAEEEEEQEQKEEEEEEPKSKGGLVPVEQHTWFPSARIHTSEEQ